MSGTLPIPDRRLFMSLIMNRRFLLREVKMNPEERTVSRRFRNAIFEEYPALEHRPFASLFCYLCFGTAKDKTSGNLLLPSSQLACFEEKQNYHASKNYCGSDLIARFRAHTGIGLHVSRYDSREGRCRTVVSFDLSDEIEALVEAERRNMWIKQDRCYFVDGRKYNAKLQRQYYRMTQAEATGLMLESGCDRTINEDTRKIGEYMNELPRNRFTKIMTHMEEAIQFVQKIENSESRRYNLNLLKAISDQPQPFYAPSERGRTVRLFSYNQSLLSLSRSVRQIITQDWFEADLRSSQLAIIGKQWDIPFVVNFLKSGNSVWDYLCQMIGVEFSKQNKDAIKECLYSLIFGMKTKNLELRLILLLNNQNAGKNFINSDLIREVLKAKERMVRQIIHDTGLMSCYGEWLGLSEYERQCDGVNSILAQNAQALEMKIIAPVFDLANSDPRLQILLFQHDGFCYTIDDFHKNRHYQYLLQQTVRQRCQKLGVETCLEIESPGKID